MLQESVWDPSERNGGRTMQDKAYILQSGGKRTSECDMPVKLEVLSPIWADDFGNPFLLLGTSFIHFQRQTKWSRALQVSAGTSDKHQAWLCTFISASGLGCQTPRPHVPQRNWETPNLFALLWNWHISKRNNQTGAQWEYGLKIYKIKHIHLGWASCTSGWAKAH